MKIKFFILNIYLPNSAFLCHLSELSNFYYLACFYLLIYLTILINQAHCYRSGWQMEWHWDLPKA